MAGTLYLVPNLLGVVAPEAVLPQRTIDIARRLEHWVVETPKAARAFVKSLASGRPLTDLQMTPLAPAATPRELALLLAPAHAGRDIGLVSDAGCPGIADPGAALVAAAHAASLRVVPLVGPSAILLALMASGMNGQAFCFHGYLPVKPDARAAALRALEARSRVKRRTELFIETPYRNRAMLAAVASELDPATVVCVAADLTLDSERIERHAAGEWRRRDPGAYDRRPALFLLQA